MPHEFVFVDFQGLNFFDYDSTKIISRALHEYLGSLGNTNPPPKSGHESKSSFFSSNAHFSKKSNIEIKPRIDIKSRILF